MAKRTGLATIGDAQTAIRKRAEAEPDRVFLSFGGEEQLVVWVGPSDAIDALGAVASPG